MIEVKCVGVNENKLPHDRFYQLFVEECEAIGKISWIGSVNFQLLGAVVIKHEDTNNG